MSPTGADAVLHTWRVLGLLFHLDDKQRITRWEPWADVEAARAALRSPGSSASGG